MKLALKWDLQHAKPTFVLMGLAFTVCVCFALALLLHLPDVVFFVFTVPVLVSAILFQRGYSYAMLIIVLIAVILYTALTSNNYESALRTVAAAAMTNAVMIELLYRLTTARRQTEARLLASQETYRSLTERVPIGIYRTSAEGAILHANCSLANMLGYEQVEEFIQKKVQDFYVEATDFQKQRQDYLQGGVIIHEMQLRRKDGQVIWVRDSGRATLDPQGRILYVDGTLEDITESKRIKEDLDRERNLLRTLIDNIPDRIYAKNAQSQKILSNDADWKSLGASSAEEVLGKTDFDMLPADIASRYWADDQSVIQSGIPLVNRVEPGVDNAGNPRWILTTKVPLRDPQGQIIGLVGIGRDITERRQIEETLHKANEKLTLWVDELEARNREARLLNNMGELLQSCQTDEDSFDVVAQYAKQLFPQMRGALYVMNNSRNLLEMVAKWGSTRVATASFGEQVFAPDDCWALRRGRVHLVADANDRLRCRHLQRPDQANRLEEVEAHPYLCIPLIAQGETLGLFHLKGGAEEKVASIEQLAVAVAERTALALANLKLHASLHAQAIRDPLTGLFNRRYMEETLEREMRRAIRYQRPLGIIMIDIDHFKIFNDTFSYAAGDALLRELGLMFKTNLRGEDVVCRYGGEEFILILPESTLEDTAKRAEQLRETCKHLKVQHRGQPLGVITISLGVSAHPQHGNTVEEILRAVDTALHLAKAEGRDRVAIAEIIHKTSHA